MSATRDQTGISSIGIQSIMPTTGTARRVTRRKPEDESHSGKTSTKPDFPSSPPLPPGIGRLVDKVV
jgi:hypothetical protein